MWTRSRDYYTHTVVPPPNTARYFGGPSKIQRYRKAILYSPFHTSCIPPSLPPVLTLPYLMCFPLSTSCIPPSIPPLFPLHYLQYSPFLPHVFHLPYLLCSPLPTSCIPPSLPPIFSFPYLLYSPFPTFSIPISLSHVFHISYCCCCPPFSLVHLKSSTPASR